MRILSSGVYAACCCAGVVRNRLVMTFPHQKAIFRLLIIKNHQGPASLQIQSHPIHLAEILLNMRRNCHPQDQILPQ